MFNLNVEEASTVTEVRLYNKVYNDLKKIADSHEISVEQLISDTILDYLYPQKPVEWSTTPQSMI